MRPATNSKVRLSQPQLLPKAIELATYLKSLSIQEIKKSMQISDKLAEKTAEMIANWSSDPSCLRPAVDSFLGDIYSGLQVAGWDSYDRSYADQSLRILSGLYGILRPSDGIYPYRLEMGYKFPNKQYANLYNFWGNSIARQLPEQDSIVNLAANEYSKTVAQFVSEDRIYTPSFLTVSPKTKDPIFVVVHAKIARGAFANWLIKERIRKPELLSNYTDLGYKYDASLSTPNSPVFICRAFGGLGLSVRLSQQA
jgi:cytoplasmic iron level regulating protein YaaA (DUF328/UPF0246 family)